MARRSAAASIVQFLADALLGSILFVVILAFAGVCTGGGARAESHGTSPLTLSSSVDAGTGQAAEGAIPRGMLKLQQPRQASVLQPSHRTMVWTLGLVFSALMALNIGFVRHLRRTYSARR